MQLPGQEPSRPARLMRTIAYGEIAVGLVLLVAGFAADTTILAIVGAVMVASSGSLFVLSRTLERQHAAAQAAEAADPDPPAIRAADGREPVVGWETLPVEDRDHLLNVAALALDGAGIPAKEVRGDPVLRTSWGDVSVGALLEDARMRPRSDWGDLARRWGRRIASRRIPPD